MSRSRQFVLELLAVGFIVLLIGKLSYDLPASRDLPAADEPAYVSRGAELDQTGLARAAYSPLYTGFYYLESFITSDLIDLFDLHWVIVSSLMCLSGYFVMRRLQVSRPVALCGTTLILSSNMLFVEPMPAHLATIVLGFGTALSLLFRRPSSSLAVAGISLAIASFIRPEFAPLLFVALIVCLIIAGVSLYRSPSPWKSVVSSVAVFGASVAGLIILLGNPLNDGRGFVAFGQHYSLNVWEQGDKLYDNPWFYWKQYKERDFPGAESIGEAVRTNPKAFAWHILQNASNFWHSFRKTIDVRLDVPKPLSQLLLVGWLLAGLAGVVGSFRRLKRERPSPAVWPWPLILMLVVILMQLSATSILIYPREHYLLPSCFFLLIVSSWGIDRLLRHSRWEANLTAPRAFVVTGILLLACLPNRTHGWNVQQLVGLRKASGSPSFLVFRDTSRTLQQLSIDRVVTILAQDGIFACYANVPFREVVPATPRQTARFWDFLDEHQVTVAVIHSTHELRYFGENPVDCAPDDFKLYPVKNSPIWIAVHEEVLQDRIARR